MLEKASRVAIQGLCCLVLGETVRKAISGPHALRESPVLRKRQVSARPLCGSGPGRLLCPLSVY